MNERLHVAIARELGLAPGSVERTIELLDSGATLPFIARYRKEQTGSLDEVQIAKIAERATYLRELEDRRASILASITEQGKLTPELRAAIEAATGKQQLEDLYLPYKPKRRTRATIAREKGYEPLAAAIYAQMAALPSGLDLSDEAVAGARDIIAEWIAERADLRALVRRRLAEQGELASRVVASKKAEAKQFSDYFDHRERAAKAPSHRILAMRRGESEGYLRLAIEIPAEPTLAEIERAVIKNAKAARAADLRLALEDAYERLLLPSCETDVRTALKERADAEAVAVFAANLRNLLLAAPFGGRPIVAIDPGLRTGCKMVALSAQGDVLANETIYPLEPRRDEAGATAALVKLVARAGAHAVAIGNGTGGREAEAFVRKGIAGGALPKTLIVAAISEAGASVYSASEVARQELPDHDVTVRGAVSIGRRLQDPLAELVKIDPKAIGVGQYQHDVDQALLRKNLDTVVESCVSGVGVDLNTASPRLLSYVAGIGPKLADNIVAFRRERGRFKSRAALREVPRLGGKAFEQAAGFLRVASGEHPLDGSGVHPERYALLERIAADARLPLASFIGNREAIAKIPWSRYVSEEVGEPTLADIAAELEKPGRDPRASFQQVAFRADITAFEHLEEGMVLEGVVTNVAAFGAFVDLGVHQDGLVHVSELAQRFVKDPHEVVKVSDRVRVRVIKVDKERRRIGLSIKQASDGPAAPPRPASQPHSQPQSQPKAKTPFNSIRFRR